MELFLYDVLENLFHSAMDLGILGMLGLLLFSFLLGVVVRSAMDYTVVRKKEDKNIYYRSKTNRTRRY